MFERLVSKLGPKYIVWMMIATRLGGLFGGAAVVYYVRLTLTLSGDLQLHFNFIASAVVLVAVTFTVLLGLIGTRKLRKVMGLLHRGIPFPAEMGSQAGREAVTFPVKHHFREAVVVPLVCLPPMYIYLPWAAGAPATVLLHITIAAMLGVSCALSTTYFVIERLMHPVVRHLTDYGVVIEYENLPTGRLQSRLIFVFTLIIVVTAVMIAALANQKVADLANFPGRLNEVIASMRTQTIIISACAVLMAVVLATLLAKSVAARVQDMVQVMRRVEMGHLDERITAISTDEIGMVGRSFNKMIARLEENQAVIRDLNTTLERKVAERTDQLAKSKERLQESYEQLQAHDKLKTEFFSNISHELRTPLTLILAPVDNLLEGNLGDLDSRQRRTLEIVKRNTVRLLNLINDLLDFAKLEARKAEVNLGPADINVMIDELVSSASLLAVERGIHLSFEPDADIPTVMLDAEKIEKVVINLVSNALKFTAADGRVAIATAMKDGHLLISVADTGIGISEKDQEKIYERFVQIDGSTSRRYEGTGLGLPLAKEFVELHGGRISLESKIGAGARFVVSIPVEPAPCSAPGEDLDTKQPTRPTNYSALLATTESETLPVAETKADRDDKILIVDDSADMLAILRTVLEPDYLILEAGSGEDGLRCAVEQHPDIIISDVMMPGMDGYEFCTRIREDPNTERTGFIMLTAKAELAMKIEGFEHGADDYLTKPFNPEELRARVRSLLKVRRLDRQLQERNDALETTLEELKRTQNHLVQSEKMSSLGQLAAGIAHEINNSINAVYNGILPLREEIEAIEAGVSEATGRPGAQAAAAAEPALDEVRESFSVVSELVEVIERGAKRTTDIVTDLKNFAHPGKGERSIFDVHEGIDLAVNLLSNRTKNRVEVHRNYCADGRLFCSGTQLSQVFLNLIDNAQQAIDGRGNIHIATERTAEQMIMRIRDDGVGLPESIRGQIFDPFFTTKKIGVGTGLGLAISYGIVKGHGGEIEVVSPPGGCERGTEFIVSLPVTAPRSTGSSGAEQSAASASGQDRREDGSPART
ncbi:MAG: response regulator [bacterium]|nr:response regulator [bacterium]